MGLESMIPDAIKSNCEHFRLLHSRKAEGEEFTHIVIFVVVAFALAAVILVLNLVTLYVVWRKRWPNSKSYKLTACLISCHVYISVITIPLLGLIHILPVLTGKGNCILDIIAMILGIVAYLAGILYLMVICLNRYAAVFHPYFYKTTLEQDRVIRLEIVSVVLIACAITVSSIFTQEMRSFRYSVTGMSVVLISVGSFSQLRAFWRGRSIRKTLIRVPGTDKDATVIREQKRNLKALHVTSFFIGSLIISSLPQAVTKVTWEGKQSTLTLRLLQSWSILCTSLASLFDPLLLCWQLSDFKRAFSDLLDRGCLRRSHVSF